MVAARKTGTRGLHIRPATREDARFILSLVPRFVAFELPRARRKREVVATLRADLRRAMRETPATDHFFIACDAHHKSVGFLRLQLQRDYFSNGRACHVSDIAVAPGHDGRGIGRVLLAHAETWARANRCKLLTLSVFPANARARGLYEQAGFATDLVRMAKPLNDR